MGYIWICEDCGEKFEKFYGDWKGKREKIENCFFTYKQETGHDDFKYLGTGVDEGYFPKKFV